MTADVNGDPGRGLAQPAPIPDEPTVAVTLGDGVAELAASEGGVIYLSLRESRCCSGTLTFLARVPRSVPRVQRCARGRSKASTCSWSRPSADSPRRSPSSSVGADVASWSPT